MHNDRKPETEPQYDDDYMTDNEQIKSSIDMINRDIGQVFKEYLKQKARHDKEDAKPRRKSGKR